MSKLHVKVHAKSKQAKIIQRADSDFEVWIQEAPDKGKANAAVIKALADHLDVPKSKLKIAGGLTSRNKLIEIQP